MTRDPGTTTGKRRGRTGRAVLADGEFKVPEITGVRVPDPGEQRAAALSVCDIGLRLGADRADVHRALSMLGLTRINDQADRGGA